MPQTSLVSLTVTSVVYVQEDSLLINFSSDNYFGLSLRPEDYTGPEAFCARFADAFVVE